MCNVFINKVQVAFGNEEGTIFLCLNDDTTRSINRSKHELRWVTVGRGFGFEIFNCSLRRLELVMMPSTW